MKYAVSFLLVMLASTTSVTLAQSISEEPSMRAVPAIEADKWDISTYNSAAQYWRNTVNADKSNEDSWINLYKCVRYAEYGPHDKDIQISVQQKLEGILLEIKSAVPNGFAFHFCNYLQKGRSAEGLESLKQAIALRPFATELYDDALSLSLINHDKPNAKLYAQKIRTETPFSPTELQYNGNVLLSLEQSSVLITNGYADTYPILVMQELDGVRTDVNIVCLDWLENETYRQQVSTLTSIDIPAGNRSQQLAALLNGKSNKPIYAGLTLPPAELSKYKKELFATGLALKHSTKGIQNYASLAYNWERFMKDQITVNDPLNRNYLIPLFHLKSYYEEQNNDPALTLVKSYITGIAAHTEESEKINTMLKR